MGVLFILSGLALFLGHADFAARFVRWQIPAADVTVFVVGALEIVGGAMLISGTFLRPVALLLATISVGAFGTAGRIDGGAYALVPPIFFGILAFIAWRGPYGQAAPKRRPGVQ